MHEDMSHLRAGDKVIINHTAKRPYVATVSGLTETQIVAGGTNFWKKNEVRYYLTYIYSDGKRLAATDGHRLHIVDTEVPAGYYDKNMNKIDGINHEFPNIDRMIPDNKKTIRFSELVPQSHRGDDGEDWPTYLFDGVLVNSTYMKQAAQYFKEPIVWYGEPTDAVLIKDKDPDDNKLAVVMPMRH